MTNALFTPSGRRDTETGDDLARAPEANSIAPVGDSFNLVCEGQAMRLTLLRVVDPARVSFFGDGSAAHFPQDWKGDWYNERRYVGVRVRMRHLEAVPQLNLPVLNAIFDPITLINSKGRSFRPDSEAWTIGVNPIDGHHVKGIVCKDLSMIQGIELGALAKMNGPDPGVDMAERFKLCVEPFRKNVTRQSSKPLAG